MPLQAHDTLRVAAGILATAYTEAAAACRAEHPEWADRFMRCARSFARLADCELPLRRHRPHLPTPPRDEQRPPLRLVR